MAASAEAIVIEEIVDATPAAPPAATSSTAARAPIEANLAAVAAALAVGPLSRLQAMASGKVHMLRKGTGNGPGRPPHFGFACLSNNR